jgi:hypothetical protein
MRETNLKSKQATLSTASLAYGQPDGRDYPNNLGISVLSEAPNEKMDSKGWNGNIQTLRDGKEDLITEPVTMIFF